ncbi:Ame1 [Kluyveromyces lactis]|nr:Ame1 [Kluyveromyces lactis]
MDALKQRHLKLLYRQRGSASRTIDYDVVIEPELREDGDLVTDGQLTEQNNESFPDIQVPSPDRVDGFDLNQGDGLIEEATANEDDIDHVIDDEVAAVNAPAETSDLVIDTNQFDSMTLSQLSTPLTSMATIDVLRRLLETVILATIEERTSQFNRAGSVRLRLKLKLEIKILTWFLHQSKEDLITISELNLSNNDLLYRLKQISLLKNSLSRSLLDVRSAISSYEGSNNALSEEQVALQNFKRINELILSQRTDTTIKNNLPPDTSTFDTESKKGLLPTLKTLNESLQNTIG